MNPWGWVGTAASPPPGEPKGRYIFSGAEGANFFKRGAIFSIFKSTPEQWLFDSDSLLFDFLYMLLEFPLEFFFVPPVSPGQ